MKNCERCFYVRGGIAEYRVRSEVIDVKVCRICADEALAIGLTPTLLGDSLDSPETAVEDAA